MHVRKSARMRAHVRVRAHLRVRACVRALACVFARTACKGAAPNRSRTWGSMTAGRVIGYAARPNLNHEGDEKAEMRRLRGHG
eukprot:6201280-Pleurochrysis_carterae.AAC.20